MKIKKYCIIKARRRTKRWTFDHRDELIENMMTDVERSIVRVSVHINPFIKNNV